MLNAAPARPLEGDLAAVTDVLVVNEIEAAMMTGLGSVEGFAEAEAAAAHLLGRVPCVARHSVRRGWSWRPAGPVQRGCLVILLLS